MLVSSEGLGAMQMELVCVLSEISWERVRALNLVQWTGSPQLAIFKPAAPYCSSHAQRDIWFIILTIFN